MGVLPIRARDHLTRDEKMRMEAESYGREVGNGGPLRHEKPSDVMVEFKMEKKGRSKVFIGMDCSSHQSHSENPPL